MSGLEKVNCLKEDLMKLNIAVETDSNGKK